MIDLQWLPTQSKPRKTNENKNIQCPRIFNLMNMNEYFRYMYITCILVNSYEKAESTLKTEFSVSINCIKKPMLMINHHFSLSCYK